MILKHLDLDDNASKLWTAVEELDYAAIAFHFSRMTYFIIINGDEENWNDAEILL